MAWILRAPSGKEHRHPTTHVRPAPLRPPFPSIFWFILTALALLFLKKNSPSNLRSKFRFITEAGLDLLSRLLTYDPEERISAEEALRHPYFREAPLPKHPDLFGSFPSAAAGDK